MRSPEISTCAHQSNKVLIDHIIPSEHGVNVDNKADVKKLAAFALISYVVCAS